MTQQCHSVVSSDASSAVQQCHCKVQCSPQTLDLGKSPQHKMHTRAHLELELLQVWEHALLEGLDGGQALLSINHFFKFQFCIGGALPVQPDLLEGQLQQNGLNQLAALRLLPNKAALVLRLDDQQSFPLLQATVAICF